MKHTFVGACYLLLLTNHLFSIISIHYSAMTRQESSEPVLKLVNGSLIMTLLCVTEGGATAMAHPAAARLCVQPCCQPRPPPTPPWPLRRQLQDHAEATSCSGGHEACVTSATLRVQLRAQDPFTTHSGQGPRRGGEVSR